MKLAVLRISVMDMTRADVVSVFGSDPDHPECFGEASGADTTRTQSGVNYCVSDADSIEELVADIRTFAEKYSSVLGKLRTLGASLDFDVAVTVGDSSQFTASIPFEARDLAAFAQLGLGLVFSAYPTSDEVNDDVASAV